MSRSSSLAFMAVLGCGNATTPAPVRRTLPPAAAPEPRHPPPPKLELTTLQFFANDQLQLELQPDGTIVRKVAGQPDRVEAILGADGSLAAHEQVIGHFGADGAFETVDAQKLPFRLDGDVLVIGRRRITIDAAGRLVGTNPALHMRVTGANDAGARRTALLLLSVMAPPGALSGP